MGQHKSARTGSIAGRPEPAAMRSAVKSSRLRSRCAGQAAVEVAFVLPIFLLLTFSIVDFGRLFYTQASLQDAVRQAGRFAVTGQHLADPGNPGKYLSRVQSIIQTAVAANPSIQVTDINVSSLAGGPNNAGGPGDTVTISLTTKLQMLTPYVAALFPGSSSDDYGKYKFTVSVSFKNEPFSPANTL